MDYLDKTIEAYDSAVSKYASATGGMVNELEMQIMLDNLPTEYRTILDVGCGPGRDTQFLKQRGYEVIGIDMSKGLLESARQRYHDIEFNYMDVRKLEFDKNSFGAIWCNAVLLHLNDEDLAAALKEIYRVLKPGGVVAISMKKGSGEKEVLETFSTDLSRFYNYKTLKLLNPMVEASGFQIIESHELNERERFGPDKRDLDWIWTFAIKPE
jgi:ubiquinone/menaquinone biosynthesis C-methylase UbiE